jgi:hypothetical protein
MKKSDKTKKGKKPPHKNSLPADATSGQKRQNANALRQANKDMENDTEFTAHSKNDDLDEGEAARLGGDNNDLV